MFLYWLRRPDRNECLLDTRLFCKIVSYSLVNTKHNRESWTNACAITINIELNWRKWWIGNKWETIALCVSKLLAMFDISCIEWTYVVCTVWTIQRQILVDERLTHILFWIVQKILVGALLTQFCSRFFPLSFRNNPTDGIRLFSTNSIAKFNQYIYSQ